jgi:hypothetical protein
MSTKPPCWAAVAAFTLTTPFESGAAAEIRQGQVMIEASAAGRLFLGGEARRYWRAYGMGVPGPRHEILVTVPAAFIASQDDQGIAGFLRTRQARP